MLIDTNETARLAALYSYDVLDTCTEESFDRITRLLCNILGTPMGLVSLVDEDRQWFKSHQGLDSRETPRDISFCTHAIMHEELMVVPDALEDERFRHSPLVTGEPHIRFYAGMPLQTPDGFNIGSLCALDRVPRSISAIQADAMADLARLVVDGLEFRKLAMRDSLTGAFTRRAFETHAAREVNRARRHGHPLGCIAFDIDHFKAINDREGHSAGDAVLRQMIAGIRPQLRAHDLLARFGGEEFVILMPQVGMEGTLALAERVRAAIEAAAFSHGGRQISATSSFGVSALSHAEDSLDAILARADAALYAAKAGGRNRVVQTHDAIH